MKNTRFWTLLIVVGILSLIWIPVFFSLYNVLTALFLMIGTVISGYAGEKFLKNK